MNRFDEFNRRQNENGSQHRKKNAATDVSKPNVPREISSIVIGYRTSGYNASADEDGAKEIRMDEEGSLLWCMVEKNLWSRFEEVL